MILADETSRKTAVLTSETMFGKTDVLFSIPQTLRTSLTIETSMVFRPILVTAYTVSSKRMTTIYTSVT